MVATIEKQQAEDTLDRLFGKIPGNLRNNIDYDFRKEDLKKHFPGTIWKFSMGSASLLEDTPPEQMAANFLTGKSLSVELLHGEPMHSIKIAVNGACCVIYSLNDYDKALANIEAIIDQMIE